MQAEAFEFVGHGSERDMMGKLSDKDRLHLVFPAGEKSVRRALSTAMGAFTGMGLSDDAKGLAEIVLAEILNNVVEHAYADLGRGIIELEAWKKDGLLWIKVQDDGIPMPNSRLPERKDQNLAAAIEHLPEGGFGWSIIHDLTRDLAYAHDGLRNTVTLSLDLDEFEASD